MKRIAFLILVFLGVNVGCMAQVAATTLTRFEGKPITGIDVSGCWQVVISQGTSTKAEITFPARLKDQLVFELQEDGELELGFRGDVRAKAGEKFTAVIVCSSLETVDMSGACTLEGSGKFTGSEMRFDLSGAAKAVFEKGELSAVNTLKVEMSGASQLSTQAMARKVDIDLSGASQLTITGSAESGNLEASGACKANLQEMTIRTMQVGLSGASKLNLNVSELIEGEISGASKVVYKGGATTRVDVSGAAFLKHN